jgi:hypothetical protein
MPHPGPETLPAPDLPVVRQDNAHQATQNQTRRCLDNNFFQTSFHGHETAVSEDGGGIVLFCEDSLIVVSI